MAENKQMSHCRVVDRIFVVKEGEWSVNAIIHNISENYSFYESLDDMCNLLSCNFYANFTPWIVLNESR